MNMATSQIHAHREQRGFFYYPLMQPAYMLACSTDKSIQQGRNSEKQQLEELRNVCIMQHYCFLMKSSGGTIHCKEIYRS